MKHILLGFTGFFTEFDWGLTELDLIALDCVRFNLVLLGFYRVMPSYSVDRLECGDGPFGFPVICFFFLQFHLIFYVFFVISKGGGWSWDGQIPAIGHGNWIRKDLFF